LLLALGAAFLLGNLAAYVRLRPVWREARQPRAARGGRDGDTAAGDSAAGKAASGRTTGTRADSGRAGPVPSRTRVLVNVVVGLAVTVASLAALISRG